MNICFICDLRFGPNPFDISDLAFTSIEEDESENLALQNLCSSAKSTNSGSSSKAQRNEEEKAFQEPCQHLCDVCLGILKPRFRAKIAEVVAQELLSQKLDSTDFNLWVRFPGSCRIREICVALVRCVQEAAEQKQRGIKSSFGLNSRFGLPQISFRDSCRIPVVKDVEKLSGLRFNRRSELSITVNLDNDLADESAQDFLRSNYGDLLDRELQRQRKRKTDGEPPVLGKFFVGQPALHEFEQNVGLKEAEEFLAAIPQHRKNSTRLSVSFQRDPLCLGGKYCKFSRYLAQTPFLVEGERITYSSVQEIICEPLLPLFGASEYRFLAAGREDVDVRMLGQGRPFGVVLLNPKQKFRDNIGDILAKYTDDLAQQQSDVRVLDLHPSNADRMKLLKLGEEEKTKTYTALCYCRQGITEEKIGKLNCIGERPFDISQRTPVRVLHRRNLAIRQRTVIRMNAILVDSHNFNLRLTTQAGTYIKEFVHGDFGRTEPSVADLIEMDEVDILELDVESVDLIWPTGDLKTLEEKFLARKRQKRERKSSSEEEEEKATKEGEENAKKEEEKTEKREENMTKEEEKTKKEEEKTKKEDEQPSSSVMSEETTGVSVPLAKE